MTSPATDLITANQTAAASTFPPRGADRRKQNRGIMARAGIDPANPGTGRINPDRRQ